MLRQRVFMKELIVLEPRFGVLFDFDFGYGSFATGLSHQKSGHVRYAAECGR